MLIKDITAVTGVTSWEGDIRAFIKNKIAGHADRMYTDRMGNLIAFKNENAPGPKIGVSAHMDEVGLVVKSIDKNGYIKFESWGIDPRILAAKTVLVGKDRIPGVIGSKAIHLQKPDERTVAHELDKLYVDIGSESKEETEKLCEIGDYISFDSEYREFGKHKVMAKALDDRLGCAAIIELLQSDTKRNIIAVFCVQEELGLRGSAIAANQVQADLFINLEGTVCADMEDVPEQSQVTVQGEGPAVYLKDGGSMYLKQYVDKLCAAAEKNNIPYQFRRTSAGSTDAYSYHTAHGGTPVIGMAVPCRYLHSPVSVMDSRDYENLVRLLKAFVEQYE